MEARLGEETGQRKIARLSPRGAGKGREVEGLRSTSRERPIGTVVAV